MPLEQIARETGDSAGLGLLDLLLSLIRHEADRGCQFLKRKIQYSKTATKALRSSAHRQDTHRVWMN
jgi:hypothetical protein